MFERHLTTSFTRECQPEFGCAHFCVAPGEAYARRRIYFRGYRCSLRARFTFVYDRERRAAIMPEALRQIPSPTRWDPIKAGRGGQRRYKQCTRHTPFTLSAKITFLAGYLSRASAFTIMLDADIKP